MPLHLALAATLGFLTFLSSLMLGFGQSDSVLPVLMGIGVLTSLFFTDYRRIIQLGDWTVNAFAILIVCFNIVDVLHHRGEDLAWSIARVLVFVQIVLLFREKNARFCWQILLISLLQVVVATVFQQSILFGMLLLLYVFVGLCAFILLFLQQEHRYFRQHSFVKSLVEMIKLEVAERHDQGKLVRIALLTLLMGPLTLVLTFGKKKSNEESSGQKMEPKKILRSLFLIFPTEEDLAPKERWEKIDDLPAVEPAAQTVSSASFHAVPHTPETANSSQTYNRFPLLSARPSFSAGTRTPRPWNGRWRELFLHLTIGTFFSFFVAVVVFCLIPRVGRVEFYDITFKPGIERWIRPLRQNVSVGTVGVNDNIKLGSLGSVIPHHREVIKARFLHSADNKLILTTDRSPNPYREIVGSTLYFRGSPLDVYMDGTWTQRPMDEVIEEETNDTNSLEGRFRATQLQIERYWELLRNLQSTVLPLFNVLEMGATIQPKDLQYAFFEEGTDLVTIAMEIKPLDSMTFFAPHPFFCLEIPNELDVRNIYNRVEETRFRRSDTKKTIVSSAFKHGLQLDITPCQEQTNNADLLQIPEKGLNTIRARAAQWDAESKCAKEDIIGRARFMEQKFLHSPEFSYQLGGIVRDYDLDPLEDFIAHNPMGHCEYFAGALAIMLRSVGIQSRIILGFKTEVQDFNAACTIRQSDAHAWVEVYVPTKALPQRSEEIHKQWWQNGGWLRLDPTPAANDSVFVKALSMRWTDWYYQTQTLWNEFVVNMNQSKQLRWIYQPLYQAGHYVVYRVFNLEFWRHLYFDMMQYYTSLFSDSPRHKRQMWDGFYLIPPFIILGLIGLAGWRLSSILRTSIRKRASEDMRRRITIEFYLRMERMLSKIGIIRASAHTPLEFAHQTVFTPQMLPVVEAFYKVRFGNVILSEEESKSILLTLELLERLIAEHENKRI